MDSALAYASGLGDDIAGYRPSFKLDGGKVVRALFTYHYVLFCLITSIYCFIDFDKHFTNSLAEKTPTEAIVYFALCCHTNVMAGEIIPKTSLGRFLLGSHVAGTWLAITLLMVPW